MRLFRLLLPALLIAVVPACSNEPTPGVVGGEALQNLPPAPDIKVSPNSKNIRADGAAGSLGGNATGVESAK